MAEDRLSEIEALPTTGYRFRGKAALGHHEPQVILWTADRDWLCAQLRAAQAEARDARAREERLTATMRDLMLGICAAGVACEDPEHALAVIEKLLWKYKGALAAPAPEAGT